MAKRAGTCPECKAPAEVEITVLRVEESPQPIERIAGYRCDTEGCRNNPSR